MEFHTHAISLLLILLLVIPNIHFENNPNSFQQDKNSSSKLIIHLFHFFPLNFQTIILKKKHPLTNKQKTILWGR